MDALISLVVRAQANDLDAYSLLVRRFQDMAVGYAYSILGDFHLSEDAAQEAFVRAYLDLGQLREPAAFAGWFRRIVLMRCNRLTRKKQITTVALDFDLISDAPMPDEILETQEMQNRVQQAIQSLPETEREVTTLYYMGGYDQKEIGAFLELPTKTVKSRLHSARKRLRERMIMVKKNLQTKRPSNDPDFQVKVMQNLEEIAQLNNRDIQRMLREVDTKDLALAMVNTSDAFKERININISARVGKIIDEYIESQMPIPEDRVAKHRAVVLQITQALIARGDITWPPDKEETEGKKGAKKAYVKMKADVIAKLQTTPISHLGYSDLTEVLTNLAEIALVEGLMTLEAVVKDVKDFDGLFKEGIQLIVDGFVPSSVEEMMQTRKKVAMHQYETSLDMIITGIQAIQLGNTPRVVNRKMVMMYSRNAGSE